MVGQTGGRPTGDRDLTGEDMLILRLVESVHDSKPRQELSHHAHESGFGGLVKIAKTWEAANILQAALALDGEENWSEKHGALDTREIQQTSDDPTGIHMICRGLENRKWSDPKRTTTKAQETKQSIERVRARERKENDKNRTTNQNLVEGNRTGRNKIRPGEAVIAQDMKSRKWT